MTRGEAKAWAQSRWGEFGFAWLSRWWLNKWRGEYRVGIWGPDGTPMTKGAGINWSAAVSDAKRREAPHE